MFYPEVVAFIEEEKDQFPSVKVQYMFASPPRLIMLDDDGQQKESIRYVYLYAYIFTIHVHIPGLQIFKWKFYGPLGF